MEISVIIPVYNVEKYLSRCLDSVLNQSLQDFEIIAVDDCGTDRSIEILKEYCKKDNRIKILSHSENKGLLQARRTGYMAASGKYFIFLDSDDYLPIDTLDTLYKDIELKNADISCGNHYRSLENGTLQSVEFGYYGTYSNIELYRLYISKKLAHPIWGKLFKRELFAFPDDLPSLDKHSIGEDMMLFYSVLKYAKKISIIENFVYYYSFNNLSLTKANWANDKYRQLQVAVSYTFNVLNGLDEESFKEIKRDYFQSWMIIFLKRNMPDIYIKKLPSEILDEFNYKNLKSNFGLIKRNIYITMYKFPKFRKFLYNFNLFTKKVRLR